MVRARAAVVLALVLAGCVRDDLTACANGTLCPVGTVCDTAHGDCVTSDQLAACDGAADETPCAAGALSGACFDGVCLAAGCGNGILEDGEICDDGNRTAGDGCSDDCTSAEVCGNGIVDHASGEACDDGNLRDHDGCDSQCRAEELHFDVELIRPLRVQTSNAVSDEASGVLLHIDPSGLTFVRSAGTWTLRTAGPAALQALLVYDTSGKRVVMVHNAGNTPAVSVLGDTAWQPLATTGAPPIDAGFELHGYYDPASHEIVVFGMSAAHTVYAVSLDTGAWTTRGTFGTGFVYAAAYDRARGAAVVAAPDRSIYTSDGATWVVVGAPLPDEMNSGTSFLYDSGRGHVVAWGGCAVFTMDGENSYGCTSHGYTFDGAAWTLVPATGVPPDGSMDIELGYDPTTDTTTFIPSQTELGATPSIGHVWTLHGGVWTPEPTAAPPSSSAVDNFSAAAAYL